MLKNRIIPCLDVKNGRVVKGINFVELKDAGDPVEQAKIYSDGGADEICFLDITASNEDRDTIIDIVKKTAKECFVPLTVGGGVRTIQNITDLLLAGADKVSINTAAVKNINFVKEYGFSNSSKFDFELLQPRFSFNMDVTDLFASREKVVAATFRGGRGLFMGRIPRVWYGNAYSRTGATGDYRGWFSNCVGNTSVSNCPGNMPKGDPTAFWLTSPDSKYSIPAADNPYGVAQSTDPNFEAPSSWRTSLGLDLLLDSGWDITLEYNLDQVREAVFFTDLGLEREGTLADGRGIYGGRGDYRLTNTDEGTTEAWTITTTKQFGERIV